MRKYMIQGSSDGGTTWEDMETITDKPISYHLLSLYVRNSESLEVGFVGAYHSDHCYQVTDTQSIDDCYILALQDEIEYRNNHPRSGINTLYRLKTF